MSSHLVTSFSICPFGCAFNTRARGFADINCSKYTSNSLSLLFVAASVSFRCLLSARCSRPGVVRGNDASAVASRNIKHTETRITKIDHERRKKKCEINNAKTSDINICIFIYIWKRIKTSFTPQSSVPFVSFA